MPRNLRTNRVQMSRVVDITFGEETIPVALDKVQGLKPQHGKTATGKPVNSLHSRQLGDKMIIADGKTRVAFDANEFEVLATSYSAERIAAANAASTAQSAGS